MRNRFQALFWLLLLPGFASAQPGAQYRTDVPVLRAVNDTLTLPWAGGLNNPQFSNIDWNNDGMLDLLVHDKLDGQYVPLVRTGTGYRFAPSHISRLPKRAEGGWVLLRDYDGDGRMDLFADTLSGVQVFRGSGTDILFTQTYIGLQSLLPGPGGTLNPVQVTRTDLPGIIDVDGDGDLDILAWNLSGAQVTLYRNQAMEQLGRRDTFILLTASACWGAFRETFNPTTGQASYELNFTNCGLPNSKTGKNNHEGGTLTPLNLNGDALMDLLVTDAGNSGIVALTNNGTPALAQMASVVTNFPATSPVAIMPSPAAFYVEATGDAAPDLLVAPHEEMAGEDAAGIWRYANTGTANAPVFSRTETDFLQRDMIDVGTSATPAFADVDADGLLDLVIGAGQRYVAGIFQSSLTLYRNIGTSEQPAFIWVTNDWLSLTAQQALQGARSLSPAFADVDADGDVDLVLGYFRNTGPNGLLLFRNEAPAGAAPQFVLRDANWLNMQTENVFRTAPTFADVDRDGDLDLAVGASSGKILFYRNIGTLSSPLYQITSRNWGGINVSDAQNLAGNARPFIVDLNRDGRPELLVGSTGGFIRVYTDINAEAVSSFTQLGSWRNNDFGRTSAPAAARLDTSNTNLYFIIGTQRGGVNLLKLPGRLFDQVGEFSGGALKARAYPNPAIGTLTLVGPAGARVTAYTATGQLYAQLQLPAIEGPLILTVADWPAGMYLFRFKAPEGDATVKVVIAR